MDHSYSTEREKVQKTDHSYFTVAKKTPKVVLRKAQLMKEHQETSRSSIGQDHSYVRPDHVVRLTEVVTDETVYDRNDADVDTFIPHLPKNNAQMPPFGKHIEHQVKWCFHLAPLFNDQASIDGAEQLWVKDLIKVHTLQSSQKIEPRLYASQGGRSNQSANMTQLL